MEGTAQKIIGEYFSESMVKKIVKSSDKYCTEKGESYHDLKTVPCIYHFIDLLY